MRFEPLQLCIIALVFCACITSLPFFSWTSQTGCSFLQELDSQCDSDTPVCKSLIYTVQGSSQQKLSFLPLRPEHHERHQLGHVVHLWHCESSFYSYYSSLRHFQLFEILCAHCDPPRHPYVLHTVSQT